MLISSGSPDNLWGEAVLSACHVLNRVPHKGLDKTPYELWKGYSPNLKFLKVWGCLAKVGLPDFKRVNIGSKTLDSVFIGYAQNSAAYRFMLLSDRSIIESCNAEFFEDEFPLKKLKGIMSSVNVSQVDPSSSIKEIEHVEPRRSKRCRTETSFGPDFLTSFLTENFHVDMLSEDFVSIFLLENDPKTYQEAITSVDANLWKEAIKSEVDSILSNHTWELTDLPKGNKPIGSKWIFKKKLRPDGTVDKYKARLVIRGFTQKHGLDYFDTYSPVTKITTIRSLISIAAINGLLIHQMDVKTAFLNGDLDEEIYMLQPEGFVVSGLESKVCKLRKSLYGLKQAPKKWYEKFDRTLKQDGYIVNNSDSCVYSKRSKTGYVLICLYVDDMLIFGADMHDINQTKAFLSSKFEMKDLGEADVILGVKIKRTWNGISLCQSHYIEQMLKKFDCFELNPVKTPYDPSILLKKNNHESVSQSEYAKIIGSVMFLMNYTRPDIAYTVSRLSRYTHNPSKEHWSAIHRLMRYLRGTMELCLHYNKFPAVLEGYCDANWVTDNDEVSSTSGYVFIMGGGAISWKSSKQTCIARSTMESEFIALELAGQEAEWLRGLLSDIPQWGRNPLPIPLHCDSKAAISVAKNDVYNGKKRHIRLRHSSVKHMLKSGVLAIDFVRSERNLADPFTKALPKKMVCSTSREMGLKPN
ncbi:hypothetical protein E3N88_08640 [Mikania micrantha]|uniref:Uncharacterized protein n=1 Tax=Mikania micrantha TaxID=192012 RepID=A0A5N6PGV2_9ASTR|nr:hypothetical protein E3N88_08640 [Mikania micrantha]